MANEINIYTPRYLMEVVRQAPPVHTFFRDTFFTKVKTFDTERVDIDITKGGRPMAAFVHPRLGNKVMANQGYKTESYKAPLVNPSKLTVADQLMNRLPGETLYSDKTPAQRAAEKLMEDYGVLNDATTRREEWMAVQAIVNGSIPVVGEGVNEVIDFGFTNKVTLTGTKMWGASAADILGNLTEWAKTVQKNGFTNVDTLILGAAAADKLMADEKLLKLMDLRRVDMGDITPRDLPNGVQYIGHLNRPNLDIYSYTEWYEDDWTNPGSVSVNPLVPDNAAVLISSRADFARAYGAVTYIPGGEGQFVTVEADRVLNSYVEHGPDRRFLELKAHPLMIPDKADSWLVATVC